MIKIQNVSKHFDSIKALDQITADIGEGQVFGLIGTNGAGKSTLMRAMCGVLRPDEGSIIIDDQNVYENPTVKSQIFYISHAQYFFNNGTPAEMLRFYSTWYPSMDVERFNKLLGILELDPGRKINTFSKGMKKQLSVLFGICAGTKYLLCDETFDGLDPVMRQTVKSLFVQEIETRGLTPIIASHNLRELEDICDHVGIIHNGEMILEKPLHKLLGSVYKYQLAFKEDVSDKLESIDGILNIAPV